MVQTLKRVYLYTAATFALLFTASITIILLNTLLNQAGMLPYYVDYDGTVNTEGIAPNSQQVTQVVILFIITVVLVGLLFGGGHYWLIRRDAHSDPNADGGVVRHLFLNALLALAALVGVPTTLAFLGGIDETEGSHDPALGLSFALVSGLVFLYIYLERRRADPIGRAAPIIRQIQEDAVQGILLIIASGVVFSGITSIIHSALVNANAVPSPQCEQFSGGGPTSIPCPPLPLLSPILTSLAAIAAWGGYVWLAAWSRGAVLLRVLWYAALGYGLIWLLYGVAQGVYTAVAPLFGDSTAWQDELNSSLPFIGQLLVGLLITVPYALWLQRLAAREPRLRAAVQQGLLAIPSALSAAFFLAGIILLVMGLVERVVPAGNPPDANGWATAVGVLVAGVLYPYFWLRLWRVSDPAQSGPTIPRRIYVLVVLAGSAIGALIAAVFMVYQIVASALSLTSANPQLARQSAVIFVVLGAMALYHLWQLRADLRVIHARTPAAPPVPTAAEAATLPGQPAAPSDAETLEAILQRVYVGALDPASAAARIRGLSKL
ncbi:MAG TPA: hypothetical protein VKT82_01870 [Ktedonobacterales bacterium]|nr:hypothetical protein [Ktedonobacterales bacterium]